VSSGYFQTLGIPVVAGRAFDDTDGVSAPRVCVVNQTFVRRFFDGRNPIGAQVRPCDAQGVCNAAGTRQIVGVVGDVRPANLEGAPLPQMYLPGSQSPVLGPMLLVRTSGDPLRLADRVVEIVHEVDRDMPVEDIRTIDMILDDTLASRRLTTMFIGLFAGIALVITLAGIASVTAFAVGQREKEIGIRIALGASGRQVLRMILGRIFLLVGVGSACGLGITIGAGNLLERLVWGTTPTDPATLIVVSVLFLLAAAASSWPALRSIHGNPAQILRAP
jgi:putative ABC transport system permease protein